MTAIAPSPTLIIMQMTWNLYLQAHILFLFSLRDLENIKDKSIGLNSTCWLLTQLIVTQWGLDLPYLAWKADITQCGKAKWDLSISQIRYDTLYPLSHFWLKQDDDDQSSLFVSHSLSTWRRSHEMNIMWDY